MLPNQSHYAPIEQINFLNVTDSCFLVRCSHPVQLAVSQIIR